MLMLFCCVEWWEREINFPMVKFSTLAYKMWCLHFPGAHSSRIQCAAAAVHRYSHHHQSAPPDVWWWGDTLDYYIDYVWKLNRRGWKQAILRSHRHKHPISNNHLNQTESKEKDTRRRHYPKGLDDDKEGYTKPIHRRNSLNASQSLLWKCKTNDNPRAYDKMADPITIFLFTYLLCCDGIRESSKVQVAIDSGKVDRNLL